MTTPDKYGCDSRDVTYTLSVIHRNGQDLTSMVSCQKGPTHHAYAWQIGPFWQDTLDLYFSKLQLFCNGQIIERSFSNHHHPIHPHPPLPTDPDEGSMAVLNLSPSGVLPSYPMPPCSAV